MSTDIYEKALEILKMGEEAVLLTVVSSGEGTPRKAGAKMIMYRDGSIYGTIGGGMVEDRALRDAKEVLRQGEARLVKYSLTSSPAGIGSMCGGEMEIFMEPLLPLPEIFIFGAGHVAQPLAEMAKMLDFAVKVVDDRPEFANAERFPQANAIFCEDNIQAVGRISNPSCSYVVLITRSWKLDEAILKEALKIDLPYIGLIGSKKKVQAAFQSMEEAGFSKERLARVYAPIGLDIGAYTPAEIAVSILAEIIAVRSGKRGAAGKWEISFFGMSGL